MVEAGTDCPRMWQRAPLSPLYLCGCSLGLQRLALVWLLGGFLAYNTVPLDRTLEGSLLYGAIQPWAMPGVDALGKQRLGRDTNTLKSPYLPQRKVSHCQGGHTLSSQREVTPN